MSRRPVLHRTPYEKPCHCEPVTDVTGVAIRNTQPIGLPVSALPTAAPFLSAAKEREERTPSKPMVLKSFPRLRCRPRRSPLAPRIGLRKPRVLPSCRLCVSIRDTRPACAGWSARGNLCAYRAAGCPHTAARAYAAPLVKPCHCEGAARPWQSAFPAPNTKSTSPKREGHKEVKTFLGNPGVVSCHAGVSASANTFGFFKGIRTVPT